MSISLWGTEFFVTSTWDGDQTFPAVQAFASGGFVSVWEDRGGATTELRGQLFYANGGKHGVEFVINSTSANTQAEPTIALLSDGRFVVAWVDDSGANGEPGWGIRARVFNPDGSAVGSDFRVNTTSVLNQVQVSIAALADGGFIVTYSDTDFIDQSQAWTYSHVLSRAFGADLLAVSPTDSVVAADAGKIEFLSDAVGLDQGYVVVFAQQDTAASNSVLRGRIFGDDGVGATEFAISDFPGGNVLNPAATRLADGRFVVVWTEEAADGAKAIKARFFEADGTASGTAFTVNGIALATAPDMNDQIGVTALPEGGFAVTYTNPASPLRWDIRAAMFDGTGQRIGADTLISPADVEGSKALPSVTTLADGRLMTTWLDNSGRMFDPVGISGQILEIRTKAVSLSGTDADDDYIGTAFHDVLRGGNGEDWLEGADGNDFLEGGAGGDTLYGGVGNDILQGGAGADTLNGGTGDDVLDGGDGLDEMSGGAGDDTYILRNLSDVAFEEAGEGFDTAVVFEDVFLEAVSTIEALTAASGARVAFLTGNDDNNRLTGNEGANTIDGRSGDDTLIGGGGDDVFIIDSQGDRVSDASGYDKVVASASFALQEGSGIELLEADASSFWNTLSLTGDSAANIICGNSGWSTLRGMGGDDVLYGKSGKDSLSGGTGRDTFVFDTKPNKIFNRDKITDFKPVDDTIYLDNSVFKKLGKGSFTKPGKLNKAFFKISDKARDKNDYVVYDKKKGVLWYDADGSGKGAAVEISTLSKKLKMSALDFFVI